MNLILQPQVSDAAIQLSLLNTSLQVSSRSAKSKSFELRDYQKQVIGDLYRLYRQGKRKPFIYAPTGAGKTASNFSITAASDVQKCENRPEQLR